MHFSKQLKSWIFPACTATACLVVWTITPEKMMPALRIMKTITLQMAIPLFVSLFVTIQLDQFLDSINAGHFPWNNSRNASVADTFCFLQVVR